MQVIAFPTPKEYLDKPVNEDIKDEVFRVAQLINKDLNKQFTKDHKVIRVYHEDLWGFTPHPFHNHISSILKTDLERYGWDFKESLPVGKYPNCGNFRSLEITRSYFELQPKEEKVVYRPTPKIGFWKRLWLDFRSV